MGGQNGHFERNPEILNGLGPTFSRTTHVTIRAVSSRAENHNISMDQLYKVASHRTPSFSKTLRSESFFGIGTCCAVPVTPCHADLVQCLLLAADSNRAELGEWVVSLSCCSGSSCWRSLDTPEEPLTKDAKEAAPVKKGFKYYLKEFGLAGVVTYGTIYIAGMPLAYFSLKHLGMDLQPIIETLSGWGMPFFPFVFFELSHADWCSATPHPSSVPSSMHLFGVLTSRRYWYK